MRRYAVVCRAKPRSSNDVSGTHDFGTACWIVTLHARGVLDPVEWVRGSAVRKRPTARGWGHGFGHRRFHPYKVVRTLSSGRRRSMPPRELQGEPPGQGLSQQVPFCF
jgi:hypothetical protein